LLRKNKPAGVEVFCVGFLFSFPPSIKFTQSTSSAAVPPLLAAPPAVVSLLEQKYPLIPSFGAFDFTGAIFTTAEGFGVPTNPVCERLGRWRSKFEISDRDVMRAASTLGMPKPHISKTPALTSRTTPLSGTATISYRYLHQLQPMALSGGARFFRLRGVSILEQLRFEELLLRTTEFNRLEGLLANGV
jgi:hypothetical protein